MSSEGENNSKGSTEGLRGCGTCIALSVPLSLIIGGVLLNQDPSNANLINQIRLLFVIVGSINIFCIITCCCLDSILSFCLGGMKLLIDALENRGSLEKEALQNCWKLFTRILCFPIVSFCSLIFPLIELGLGAALYNNGNTVATTANIAVAAIATGGVQIALGVCVCLCAMGICCLACFCGFGAGMLGYQQQA